MTNEWTFGNPAFDAAYDRWRLATPYDDEVDYEEEQESEEEEENEND